MSRCGETIRTLGIEEYDAIMALWREAGLTSLRPRGRDSRDAMAAQLATGVQTVLGLKVAGHLIGVVVASHDGRKGWINRLAVDAVHRRHGHGRALIAAAEERLRSDGIRVIAALIEEENEASIALFRETGYEPGRDILYLSKRGSRDD